MNFSSLVKAAVMQVNFSRVQNLTAKQAEQLHQRVDLHLFFQNDSLLGNWIKMPG